MTKTLLSAFVVAALSTCAPMPAMAQPAEICLTRTIGDKKIEQPMCFVPYTLSEMKTEQCSYYPTADGSGKIIIDTTSPLTP
jgi:hypothetical protein